MVEETGEKKKVGKKVDADEKEVEEEVEKMGIREAVATYLAKRKKGEGENWDILAAGNAMIYRDNNY